MLPLAGFAANLSEGTLLVPNLPYGTNAATHFAMDGFKLTVGGQVIEKTGYEIEGYYATQGGEKITDPTTLSVRDAVYYVKVKAKEGSDNTGTVTGSFQVVGRPVTITFTAVQQTYGYQLDENYTNDAALMTYTLTEGNTTYQPFSDNEETAAAGLAFVETLGLTVGREDATNYNVKYTTGANPAVTGYAFTFEAENDNYAVTRAENNATLFTIQPKALANTDAANITFTAGTHVYNGNKQVGTFANAEGYDFTYDVTWYSDANLNTAVATPKEVGTYYAKLTGKGNYSGSISYDANDEDNGLDEWSFNITRRPVTIEIVDGTKVYDGKVIDLSTVTINYNNIAPADAVAATTNFGGAVAVGYPESENGSDKKSVKWTTGTNPSVTSYALVLTTSENAFEHSVLYKNYGIEDNNGNVEPIVLANITGKYTITQRPVTFKANTVTINYGDNKPDVPAVTIGDASKQADVEGDAMKTVLYVAPTGDNAANEGIVVINENSDLTSFVAADFKLTLANKLGSYNWNVAPADTYNDAVTLAKGATATNYSAISKNYDITYQNGAVKVNGLAIRVNVNIKTVEYGDAVNDATFSYSTVPANLQLGGTVTYKIYEIEEDEITGDFNKGEEMTSAEILPVGTYWVEIDEDQVEAPTNYTLGDFNPGYLVVKQKAITVNVPLLTLNVNDTEETLNEYISPKTYETGVNNETISFVYSFNTEGDNAVETANIVDGDNNVIGKKVTSAAGTYANGIAGAVIDDEEDAAYSEANGNYDVTFNFAGLKLVATETLVLADNDPNLAAKIEAAAAVCTETPATQYGIEFGSRELKREVWAAMVLPFETTVTEISAALGYAVVDILDEDNTTNDMHLKLHMGKINANQPFIAKYYKEDEPVVYYTQEEVNAYNATIDGHRSTEDIKTTVTDNVYFTKGEIYDAQAAWSGLSENDYLTAEILPVLIAARTTTYNYTVSTRKNNVDNADVTAFLALVGEENSDDASTLVKVAGTFVYYTQEECDAYNATLPGARKTTDVKTAAVDHSTLDLNTLALPGKKIVYDADADYVNEDGNVFVQNANNGHQFIGVYNPVEVYGANYKWIRRSDGALVDAANYTEDNKAPMRRLIGYFKLNTTNARILIDEPDGSTTVINAVTAETMNVQADGWYTLNGVKLQSIPTQKGIYINNGKKVVIK